jgi:hypothetical protein
MKQFKMRFSLATAVFLVGATAAFAQTTPAPNASAQIAFKHHRLPKSFSSEAAAKESCKTPVIWAQTKARVYYSPASAKFGTARPGVYACVKDAIKAGYRKGAV